MSFSAHITSSGAKVLDAAKYYEGIFARGVLIDIPWLRGLPYLPTDALITAHELDQWEEKTGVGFGKAVHQQDMLSRLRIGARFDPTDWLTFSAMGQEGSMLEIRSLMAEFALAERRLLDERSALTRRSGREAQFTLLLGSGASIALLLAALGLILRDIAARQQAETQLAQERNLLRSLIDAAQAMGLEVYLTEMDVNDDDVRYIGGVDAPVSNGDRP